MSFFVTIFISFSKSNTIQSSYELLWREIKEWEQNSGITIQNTTRRIIENFFRTLGLGYERNKTLITQFDTEEERMICREFFSWQNSGSHIIPDDLYAQNPEQNTEKYLKVFEDIFKYTKNSGHYKLMKKRKQ